MISTEMARKLARREFDAPDKRTSCAKRIMNAEVERIYELADEGCDLKQIADRVGITSASVAYRLKQRTAEVDDERV